MRQQEPSSVSVIIPTYNRAGSISRAVDSVLAQTYESLEIIVVDDGSTDNTRELIKGYGEKVKYIYKSNSGVSAARNVGVRASSSEFVAFLDSDDYWLPYKLEQQVPAMLDESVVLSYTDWKKEQDINGRFASMNIFPKLPYDVVPHPIGMVSRWGSSGFMIPSAIVKKKHWMRVGGFDERLTVAEDTRFLFRMAYEGAFAVVPEVLIVVSDPVDLNKRLTRPDVLTYHAALAEATVEILMEAYARGYKENAEANRNLRRLLTFFLTKQSLILAREGDFVGSRRRALDALRFGVMQKEVCEACLCAVAPSFVKWLYSCKGRDSSDDGKGDKDLEER